MKVSVIGAGSWGTAVAWLLGEKSLDVTVWAREPDVADGINDDGRNPVFLSDVTLAPGVRATTEIKDAVGEADAVAVAVPSHGVRGVAQSMSEHLPQDVPVINLAKGIEQNTLMRMTQVLEEVLGNQSRLAALSGPNHAEEVSKGVPSATVVAAYSEEVAGMFQDLFMAPTFRVYTNPDVIGVELGGASKNVIAIAAGIVDGLGFGDNTKATLMTRGLAEMSRLGSHLGANPITYMGLSGVGDLIATCTSKHSRNRGLGEWVAGGGTVDGYEAETRMVAEGAKSAIALDDLAARLGIEMPITRQVRAILYEGHLPGEAAAILMGRAAVDEFHGMGLVEDD